MTSRDEIMSSCSSNCETQVCNTPVSAYEENDSPRFEAIGASVVCEARRSRGGALFVNYPESQYFKVGVERERPGYVQVQSLLATTFFSNIHYHQQSLTIRAYPRNSQAAHELINIASLELLCKELRDYSRFHQKLEEGLQYSAIAFMPDGFIYLLRLHYHFECDVWPILLAALNCKGTTAHCIDLPLREHYTAAMHKHSTCMLIDCTATVNNDRATKRALQDISGLNFTLKGCALLVCYAYAPPLQLLSLA